MEIRHIVIVGAGTMGNGIAQAAAVAGYRVTMTDVIPEALERGKAAIARSASKLAEKGSLTAAQKEAALQVAATLDLESARRADLVIEAATENPASKLRLFADLDRLAPPGGILASNTSSIPITKIAASPRRPGRAGGMAFFNPGPPR